MRLYSTANERGFDLNRLFVCLSAKCRRDARDPAVSPAFQDRMRLYSTANERGFDLNSFFVCLSAKCRRDARDPAVSPAFQDRTRLYSTANERGLTSQAPFCLPIGKVQAGRPRSVGL
ncbi:MAG: hypothetical protein LBP59_16480 [Planctomycetaceae bacterium]|nr:hypothetical protein [Planctomycetaceae bacterium]